MVHLLRAPVVLVTTCRRGAISNRVRELLIDTARDVCVRHGATVVEADGQDEDLHPADRGPAEGRPGPAGGVDQHEQLEAGPLGRGWPEVTRGLWGQHFWSPSYFAVAAGGAPLEAVAAYVRNQRNPNRGRRRPASR